MVGCDTHTDLANRRFRPLSHLSGSSRTDSTAYEQGLHYPLHDPHPYANRKAGTESFEIIARLAAAPKWQ
jgi:hypothetical protein